MAKNIEVTLTLDSKNFNRGIKSAQTSLGNVKGSTTGAGGAFTGLASKLAVAGTAFLALKKSIDGVTASVGAARQIQDIGVVLRNVVGSAEGGAMALQQVRDIATELPFAFEEIAGATPALATVSKDLNELEENTRLAADIAAVSGLSFQEAASQIQRSFAGGIGAADLFREKGIKAMAGFEEGASYSIEETRRKLKEFGESIDGAANDLNVTLTGALSQAGDRLFNFQSSIGDAILPEFTEFINQIVTLFDQNRETITKFAKAIGEGVVNAFYTVLEVGAVLVDYFTMLFNALKSVATFVNDKFGEVFYSVFNSVAKIIGGVVEAVATLGKGIGYLIELAGGSDDVTQFFDNIQNAANKVRTDGLAKFGEAMDDVFTSVPVTTAQDFVANLISNMQQAGVIADEEAEKIIDKLANTANQGATKIKNGAKEISSSLADYKTAQESILSVAASSFDKLSQDMATAVLEGGNVMKGLKDMFKSIVKEMIAQAIKLAIIKPILDSIFGVFGFGVSLDGGKFSISKLTPPGMATGGPVMKNKPYVVGERGPELFVPNSGGSIIPNNQLGGATHVTYNIQAVDAPSFQQLVARDPEFIYSVTRAGQRRLPGVR